MKTDVTFKTQWVGGKYPGVIPRPVAVTTKEKVLEYIVDHPGCSTLEITEALGCRRETTQKYVYQLLAAFTVRRFKARHWTEEAFGAIPRKPKKVGVKELILEQLTLGTASAAQLALALGLKIDSVRGATLELARNGEIRPIDDRYPAIFERKI